MTTATTADDVTSDAVPEPVARPSRVAAGAPGGCRSPARCSASPSGR